MHPFELTRRLIDIESITPNELAVSEFLWNHLQALSDRYGGSGERMEVEPGRNNLFFRFGEPTVVFSTHMDTVPPFIQSSEDEEHIWGRGACDTKGIIASMIQAVEELLLSGVRNIGLLFVVGEERNSAGALHAAQNPRGCRFLINGEPTENKLALGSKGTLRYEITATGRMAHSAYPELGDSAIHKLLDALESLRKVQLPTDELLGPSTLNIGVIEGGHAPNVIADWARAEVLIRVVDDTVQLHQDVVSAIGERAQANKVLFIPALQLGAIAGFETTVVAFTTDIPAFGDSWGKPYLMGPGTIHVAHTAEERIAKRDILQAISQYKELAQRLLQ